VAHWQLGAGARDIFFADTGNRASRKINTITDKNLHDLAELSVAQGATQTVTPPLPIRLLSEADV
jgi:hypothetical protein